MTPLCPTCKKPISGLDVETLLLISSEGRSYEKLLCGPCGKNIKTLVEKMESRKEKRCEECKRRFKGSGLMCNYCKELSTSD